MTDSHTHANSFFCFLHQHNFPSQTLLVSSAQGKHAELIVTANYALLKQCWCCNTTQLALTVRHSTEMLFESTACTVFTSSSSQRFHETLILSRLTCGLGLNHSLGFCILTCCLLLNCLNVSYTDIWRQCSVCLRDCVQPKPCRKPLFSR